MDMGSIDIKGSFSLFKQSERYISPVLSLESENNYNFKIKFLKNDIKAFINAKIKNIMFLMSLNFDSYKQILHPTKNNFKYSINVNFK